MDKMKEFNESFLKELSLLLDDPELFLVFGSIPVMSVDVYKRTSYMYAQKCYEEFMASGAGIPRGFYTILEDSVRNIGFLATVKKYDKEIRLISDTMNIPYKDLLNIIKCVRETNGYNVLDDQNVVENRSKLREIIRKFTSKHKEDYISSIVRDRNSKLDETLIQNDADEVFHITPEMFLYYARQNPVLRSAVIKLVFDKTGKMMTDSQFNDLILSVFSKNYEEEIKSILGIRTPKKVEIARGQRDLNRLANNYAPRLNQYIATLSPDEAQEFFKILGFLVMKKRKIDKHISDGTIYRTKANFKKGHYRLKPSPEGEPPKRYRIVTSPYVSDFHYGYTGKTFYLKKDEISRIKASIPKDIQQLLEEVSSILTNENINFGMRNGKIFFKPIVTLNEEEKKECKEFANIEKNLKSLHDIIYHQYKKLSELTGDFANKAGSKASANDILVDTSKWLDISQITELLEHLNIQKIKQLSLEDKKALNTFLYKKGLMWAYIAGNIDIKIIAKIINNFEPIRKCTSDELLTVENINDIIKKANLYDYADDITIGLLGLENVAKIINYNQFSGVTVTDDIIKQRLRKAVDLAVRSERVSKSSLPFRAGITLGDYSLVRYRNNDPEIFTCGVDTQTCFFISVNENDFFFYSLLNKNGYVVKIVDKSGKLVARATCFRKNNVLMINGIRCVGNKVIPENKEESMEFDRIVQLVELMAKKIIETTSSDKCPIDYVVCNKAGLLENACYENKYEKIESALFSEPINVYDSDWQEFVHMYDDEEEQMLQEVPYSPNKSFTTDFGNHYPALLIASRNWKELTRPSHISMNDQDATYERPRAEIEEYITDELDNRLLNKINRIKALSCFVGTKEEQEEKKKNYRLITDKSQIKNIILGDDWYISVMQGEIYEIVYANNNRIAIEESKAFIEKIMNANVGFRLTHIASV